MASASRPCRLRALPRLPYERPTTSATHGASSLAYVWMTYAEGGDVGAREQEFLGRCFEEDQQPMARCH
eukprot:195529-Chlamydomonas_euryale.AAC.7